MRKFTRHVIQIEGRDQVRFQTRRKSVNLRAGSINMTTEGRLEDYFTGPKLADDQYDQVKNHEGWILGVLEVRERSVENVQVQEPASSYQVEYTATPGKHTELITARLSPPH